MLLLDTSRILAKFVFMIFHGYCVSGSSVFILLRSFDQEESGLRTSGGRRKEKKLQKEQREAEALWWEEPRILLGLCAAESRPRPCIALRLASRTAIAPGAAPSRGPFPAFQPRDECHDPAVDTGPLRPGRRLQACEAVCRVCQATSAVRYE